MKNTYWKIIGLLGGRKCFLVSIFSIILEAVMIIASIVFVAINKLTPEWISIFKIFSSWAGILIIGYTTGNIVQKKNGK